MFSNNNIAIEYTRVKFITLLYYSGSKRYTNIAGNTCETLTHESCSVEYMCKNSIHCCAEHFVNAFNLNELAIERIDFYIQNIDQLKQTQNKYNMDVH